MVISHKKFYIIISLSILMLFVGLCSSRAENSENAENNSLVGHIAHIDGQFLRYVPEEEDWVVAAENTPFGNYDVLYSSEDAKAEIIMPNNTPKNGYRSARRRENVCGSILPDRGVFAVFASAKYSIAYNTRYVKSRMQQQ